MILVKFLDLVGPVMNNPVIFVRFIGLHVYPICLTGSVAFGADANSGLARFVQLLLALDTGVYVLLLGACWAEPVAKRQLLAPNMKFEAVALLAASPLAGLAEVCEVRRRGFICGLSVDPLLQMVVLVAEPLILVGSLLGWGLSSAGWCGVAHSHIFMVGLAVGFFHFMGSLRSRSKAVAFASSHGFKAVATDVQ